MSRLTRLLPLIVAASMVGTVWPVRADDPPARPAAEAGPPHHGPQGPGGPPPPPPDDQRRERDGKGDRDHGWDKMSPEEVDEAIEIVRQLDPPLAERLEAQRGENPEQVVRELNEGFPKYRWLVRMKRYDPQMFELRIQDIKMFRHDRELAEAYKQAQATGDKAATDKAYGELLAHMQQHFDHRRKIDELELQRLEQRLESLRQEIEERKANRDELIDKYIGMLLDAKEREKDRKDE